MAVAALSGPAFAADEQPRKPVTAWEASRAHEDDGMIATGVARARDRLDSATSTSSLADVEITKVSATSLGDLFRNIPGIRAEASGGEGNNNYTIRGLPLSSTGAKYLQFQEDGLPVLEFGDILAFTPDSYLRTDFNIAQIESIRGGSASTFASNAPGGVINLISKTGEVEGGSVEASTGLTFGNYRADIDYGGHLSDTVRFHVGGFYRSGGSPRHAGYDSERGGQIKFNITKEFTGGFVRLYAKYLDDRNSFTAGTPMAVSGTDSDPKYESLANFSILKDGLNSRNLSALTFLDGNNAIDEANLQDGTHVLARSVGMEAKFTLGDWSISERARYSRHSGTTALVFPLALLPAVAAPFAFGAPGGSLAYASGPLKGQAITDPLSLNGNGLVAFSAAFKYKLHSADNLTNDVRVSRVWDVGGADLTSTAGFYASRQDVIFDRSSVDLLQDINGNGNSALIDIINPDGTRHTQDGVIDFNGPAGGLHSIYNVQYTVLAPYGSLNLRRGKVAIGGSIRVDAGKADGTIAANGPADFVTIDVDHDGIITDAERTFAVTPSANTMPVNYRYHYVSYSGSINYRVSASFSTFARYSRGGRAGSDRLLFSSAIDPVDGSLAMKSAAYDPVKQAELGVKFRRGGIFVNATGFWAKVSETNTQIRPDSTGIPKLELISRAYRAFGAELEAGIRRGPFSLTGSATATSAKITAADVPGLVGKTPRHQAPLIFQIMPQYDTDLFTVGATVIGSASSYSQDENLLKMNGYATVNMFLQVRPVEKVVVSLNVSNMFNTLAMTEVSAVSMPASNLTIGRSLLGRTIWSGVRYYF